MPYASAKRELEPHRSDSPAGAERPRGTGESEKMGMGSEDRYFLSSG